MDLTVTERFAEIDGVIAYIHKHMYDQLPLERLARYAGYSPYHFVRIFKERTGLSPLYYVSSHRLQRAKDMLLRTGLTVRDISLEIGQQSLGTFTSRFAARVGMSPAEFRNSVPYAGDQMSSLRKLRDWSFSYPISEMPSSVHGTVSAEAPVDGVILIGLFAKPIPEGLPLYGTLLSSLGHFHFEHVAPGTYYLLATSISWGTHTLDFLLPHTTLRTRSKTPIHVVPGSLVPHQPLTLHPPRLDDPPILISLPLLMNRFLNRMAVR